MNHVYQFIWIFYFFVAIPLVCGIAWQKMKKIKNKKMSDIYIYGYMVYFAVYFLYARIYIAFGHSFEKMAKGWLVTGTILFIAALLYVLPEIPHVLRENFALLKQCKGTAIGAMIFYVVVVIVSVLFVIPSPEDATPEILMTTISTDTVYENDPYTGICYPERIEENAVAPIEMLYATVCRYTGLTPVKFVHGVLPVPFFFLFYFIYNKMAKNLFGKNEGEKDLFFVIVIVCYLSSLYTKRAGAFGVFQNIWMPLTLLLQVWMPFVFCTCVSLMSCLMKKDKIELDVQLKDYIGTFVMLFLSCSLVHYIGGFLVCFLLFMSLLIVFVRKEYRKCRK